MSQQGDNPFTAFESSSVRGLVCFPSLYSSRNQQIYLAEPVPSDDEAGNRKTLDLDSTPFVAYDYDNALRLESITRGSDVFAFDYDVASRRTSMVYPNEIETTYEYDGESRLERITAMLDQTVITDFLYSYNAVGNRTQKVTPDLTETYAYDRADQLVEVVRTGTAANRWHYAYDPAGNRTTEQIGNSPVQASYDDMNRLLSTSAGGALAFKGSLNEPGTVTIDGKPAEVDGSNAFQGSVQASSGTNTVTVVATDPSDNTRTDTYEVEVSGDGIDYEYDESGNLIEKDDGTDVWTYEWDAENQLIEVLENETTIASFAYDPIGRRVEKVVGATTTTFTYDGVDILRQTSGGTTTYYVHGPAIDEPLAKEVSGITTYYHADSLGSILRLTDAAGDVDHEYLYDAYGRIEAGASQGGYSFTGREWDPETGLYFYRARYYDASTGRWLSEDPIGLRGGLNLYRYVGNAPTRFRDPFGLCDDECVIYRVTICSGCLCTTKSSPSVGCPDPKDDDFFEVIRSEDWSRDHGCASPYDKSYPGNPGSPPSDDPSGYNWVYHEPPLDPNNPPRDDTLMPITPDPNIGSEPLK